MTNKITTSRNPVTEVFRYIGAVGIVWFHLNGPEAWIGHAALEFFIIISVFFALCAGEARSQKRVLRIWLFWSVVYSALKILQALIHSTPVVDEFSWWMLLTGPSLPLWFLPFIYVMNGFSVAYSRTIKSYTTIEAVTLGMIAAGSAIASPLLPIPLAQWALGFAAVTGAIVLFRASQGNWVALAIWMIPIIVVREELLLLSVPIAAGALFFSVNTEAQWPYVAGQLALPIYVLHSGVASLTGLNGSVTDIITVVIICTVLGAVLRRAPIFRSYL